MASGRKSYPKRSNYSVQDLIEYLGESDKLSDISSNDGSSNEGSVKSVTEEEIICSSSADDDSETGNATVKRPKIIIFFRFYALVRRG